MKTKDKKELQTKTINELNKMLKEAHEAIMIAKLDKEQNKLKDTRSLYHLRKKVAVLKTILNIKKVEEGGKK